jgi:hypothetical protein
MAAKDTAIASLLTAGTRLEKYPGILRLSIACRYDINDLFVPRPLPMIGASFFTMVLLIGIAPRSASTLTLFMMFSFLQTVTILSP